MLELRPIGKGILTFVPGLMRLRRGGTRGTDSARYCYTVWLRHHMRAHQHGLNTGWDSIAELGPGDSLGIGIAALLTGVRSYTGLDVVRYSYQQRNIQILHELARLFRTRAALPADEEFPGVYPKLDSYDFPEFLDTPALDEALHPDRIRAIEACLHTGEPHDGISVQYAVPWYDRHEGENTVDLVYSQACLEHVDDLDGTYAAMRQWLRPGGVFSHEIDFRSHKLTRTWDGHRQYPPGVWTLVRGRRPYLLNREPLSRHLELLQAHGFQIVECHRREEAPGLHAHELPAPFCDFTPSDLRTSGATVLGTVAG